MVTLGDSLQGQLDAIIQTIEGGRPSRALDDLRRLRKYIRDNTPAAEWKAPDGVQMTATGPLVEAREYGSAPSHPATVLGLSNESAIKAAKLLQAADQCTSADVAYARAEERWMATGREREAAAADFYAKQSQVHEAYARLHDVARDANV